MKSPKPYCNENGAVLVISLMFMAILGILGTTAYFLTSTDLRIGNNYKTSLQAFNAAQAGIEEARARMRGNAADPITDGDPTNPSWETYIPGNDAKLVEKLSGYDSGDTLETTNNPHAFTDMDYAVQIRHALDTQDLDSDGNTNEVLYWGDSTGDGVSERNTTMGNNIYLATSYGMAAGAAASVTVEITSMPPVDPAAALYVEDALDVNSSSAEVDGNDQCGGSNNLPGAATTESKVSATNPVHDHHSNIDGSTPKIKYAVGSLGIQDIIDNYKSMANYNISPGNYSNQHWGTPTGMPATPDCTESNIVYASGDIKLTKCTGCGILLVDGDLDFLAGSEWYGMIFVSGCLKNTGAAGSAGIYGAVMTQGTSCDNSIKGNIKIHYCSTGVDDAAASLPLKVLSWKDNYN